MPEDVGETVALVARGRSVRVDAVAIDASTAEAEAAAGTDSATSARSAGGANRSVFLARHFMLYRSASASAACTGLRRQGRRPGGPTRPGPSASRGQEAARMRMLHVVPRTRPHGPAVLASPLRPTATVLPWIFRSIDLKQTVGDMARTTGTASLLDLIAGGVLRAGEELELRRRSAPPLRCTLRADGRLEVSGQAVGTPSRAARLALGTTRPTDGWERWRVARLGGRTLAQVRAAHLS